MGENSLIQWTHHTFNPWVGCQRISPGCTNCYAEAYDRRVGGRPKNQRKDPDVPELRWGPTAPRVRTSAATWGEPLRWNRAAEKAGERHRVFCASLADVFEDRAELVPWRTDLFELIRSTPHLDWLLLTKRPANVGRLVMGVAQNARVRELAWSDNAPLAAVYDWALGWLGVGVGLKPSPPPNVWLGTTVEDQLRADKRIPELLAVPAAVRFLSCEPLLERVDLSRWMHRQPTMSDWDGYGWPPGKNPSGISWVIIGGESGPNARPFDLDWARDLVAQCRHAGVAPFVKQLGANVACQECGRRSICVGRYEGHGEEGASCDECCGHGNEDGHCHQLTDPAGGDPNEWPEDLRVREFPR